ncbi:hypothetical protein BO71DRAFT_485788 [Aspergillus ellipticus CBS 707.79]|uniref:Uncharacterized protein n=1 Tax=Aspergillus ellipticus CBS 707.79 TaxID=1448320 RepID=A0A319DL55_9EURO|nr:hypothetical protein BO71DRAFT_485788 [Aspergillus ellipticus CBS 707.79]
MSLPRTTKSLLTPLLPLLLILNLIAATMWTTPLSFLLTTPALLLPATNAHPILPTNNKAPLDTLITAITHLSTDYTNFYHGVQAFHGTPEQYNEGLAAELIVERSIHAVISAANAVEPLNDKDSRKVLETMRQPYPEFMKNLLDLIKTKTEPVAHLGKTYEVKRILENLNRVSDMLAMGVEKKVVKEVADAVAGGRKWVDELFLETIRAYGA